MADDQIVVQILADTSQLEVAMQQAGAACQKLGATATSAADKSKKKTEDWTNAFKPLQHAFDQSISGMILGTTTWQKAVKRLGQMAVSEMVGVADKQLATWVGKELGMTTATKAGTQTRQGAEEQSESGFLGLIGNMLLKWLGLETAKTDGTATNNAARAAIEAAAAKLAVLRAFGQIEVDAAVAAAGAMAAISAIPYVGPALAPEVAAETYATTMGWATGLGAGLFSAAGGMWNVPADTLAMVHKQESIIPASVAQPMRDFFSGGASGGASYAITIQAIDTQSGAQFLMNNAPLIAKSLAREMRNGNPALRKAV